MPRKSVEDQPSTTAFFTALRRSLIYMEDEGKEPGKDSQAVHFIPPLYRFLLKIKPVRDKTAERLETALPGMNAYVFARTAFFDNLFLDALMNEIPQVVLLGAGYDSRAYRFSKLNHSSQVYELDISPTQERKKTCLRKAHIEITTEVKLLPVNFNTESLGEALDHTGYRTDERTLFIWEGVSYYLDPQSVDATLDFVSRSSPETKIALDYMVRVPSENFDQVYGLREFDIAMNGYHKNEALKFMQEEGEIESFLAQRGLELVEHLNNEEIEEAYLTDEKGVASSHITGHFRFVVASPRGSNG